MTRWKHRIAPNSSPSRLDTESRRGLPRLEGGFLVTATRQKRGRIARQVLWRGPLIRLGAACGAHNHAAFLRKKVCLRQFLQCESNAIAFLFCKIGLHTSSKDRDRTCRVCPYQSLPLISLKNLLFSADSSWNILKTHPILYSMSDPDRLSVRHGVFSPLPQSFLGLLVMVLGFGAEIGAEEPISFQNVIRPILVKNCFECHGPDEAARKADLRLDHSASAFELRDGVQAIAPGKPEESEILKRMTTLDPDDRMPPLDSHRSVTEAEIASIRQWIVEGAAYAEHWAFVPPQRSSIPSISDPDWAVNEIDHFVLARLDEAGLEPNAPADRYALIRRVYLDLIGMLPSPSEVDLFVQDDKPNAYGRLVDRLLVSPQYGERWARAWLDLARYSDTNGYEKDRERSIWPYRDWVIKALNADIPYDQFSIEQLAGDMLPNATEQQRVATGFHRNTMLNEEGGIDPLEYRFYAMVDRVATTGTVWMGLTTGCAQCHSHKYDPISHTEYYGLMALLNNADEPDLILRSAEEEKRRVAREARLHQGMLKLRDEYPVPDGVDATASNRRLQFHEAFGEWGELARKKLVEWKPLRPSDWETNLGRLEVQEDLSIFASGDATKRDVYKLRFPLDDVTFPIVSLRLDALPDDRLPARGPGRAFYEGRKGDFFLSELVARVNGKELAFTSGSRSYGKISVGSGDGEAKNVLDREGSTGWSTSGREGESHYLVLQLEEPLTGADVLEVELLFERHFVASLGRFRISVSGERGEAVDVPETLEGVLSRDHVAWTDNENESLQRIFIRNTPVLAEARKALEPIRRSIDSYQTTMVMQERPGGHVRKSVRHHRGEYLSPREEVSPGVPLALARGKDIPRNRLEFARWLVSDRNPLVGRVTVNRAWRAFFGKGLLETSGDFGTQSNPPSHPQLLDWLAVEFMETGWSMKKLHRLIVMSQTYRQSVAIDEEKLRLDPENRLFTRGPRYRLDGEIVRDAVLSASGLMSDQMLGPSVRPPQPAAVTAFAYGNTSWKASKGADRFRRSLYTYNKRTAPFAAFTVFDAPSGENCTAKRNRSNTPLQALTMMNDEMFLEFARALALNVTRESSDDEARITAIVRRLTTRPPDPEETAWLLDYQRSQFSRLEAGELEAKSVLKDLEGGNGLASWVMLSRAVMNLDETVTK